MIALSTIKKALKIDYTTDDQELLRIRDAAFSFIEEYTGLKLQSSVKTQYINYWMRTALALPFNSMTTVKYTNSTGTIVTMPSTDYWVDRSCEPNYYLNFLEYPDIKEGTDIELKYSIGYAVVPKEIEQVAIGLIGAWYNNPEATAPINLSVVPLSCMFIMDNMRAKAVIS